jgi:tripartite-type tricarboxylate transporter receptor subunit TctC
MRGHRKRRDGEGKGWKKAKKEIFQQPEGRRKMKRTSMHLAIMILMVMVTAAFITRSEAKEGYPNKPIQIICPFPAGGALDQFARITASKLEPLLGEKVIVLNKTGGGGTTGTAWAAQQKPDGYTLLVVAPGPLTSRTIVEKVPYSYKDFEYIAQLCTAEEIVAVQADAPWKTIEEFIEDARKNPGKYSYATSGAGSMGHILMETLKDSYKLDVTHIAFKGSAPAITALLGGHVQLCVAEGVFEPHVKAKTVREIFTGIASKYKINPNIKNFGDLGHNIDIDAWGGLCAPKGTPKEIIKKWETSCKTISGDESYKEMLRNIGAITLYIDADDFSKKVERNYLLFKKMLDKLGLSAK